MAACAIDIPVQRVGGSCLDWSRNNVNMGLSGVLTFLLLLLFVVWLFQPVDCGGARRAHWTYGQAPFESQVQAQWPHDAAQWQAPQKATEEARGPRRDDIVEKVHGPQQHCRPIGEARVEVTPTDEPPKRLSAMTMDEEEAPPADLQVILTDLHSDQPLAASSLFGRASWGL